MLFYWAARAKDRIIQAALETDGEVLPNDGSVNPGNYMLDNLSGLSQETRATKNKVGITTQKKLDHLARHSSNLLEKVQQGELSADRAYKISKGIKDPTPLDNLKKWWNLI